jgi:hypothetical protein
VAYDAIIKGLVEEIWHKNQKLSVREIRLKCVADRRIGDDCPSPKTISNWINEDFKPTYHPLGAEEEDVIDPWSEVTDGPFDHERIKTLTVLAHVASQVMDRYAIKGFKGFTKRQANWACKLQGFFNLSNQSEARVLLLFTFQYSQKERFELEMDKPTRVDPSDPLSEALMAWVWWDPSSETSRSDRLYPWEYGEEQTSRMVAIASGLLPEPIDITPAPDEPIKVPPVDPQISPLDMEPGAAPTIIPRESTAPLDIPSDGDIEDPDDYDWNNTA